MKLSRDIKEKNVGSVYETCQHSRFVLSNGKNEQGVH